MWRESASLRPVVGLVLLPLIVVALTLWFLGLALWELGVLLWHLAVRVSRTGGPGPTAVAPDSSSGSGDTSPQTSDPTLCVPAPRPPAEDSTRLRALSPARSKRARPKMTLLKVALPWANLLRAKMGDLYLAPG
jgi:hypothetical protein